MLSGDAPLAGQWQYGVYTRDFTSANNQTSTITSGTLRGAGYVDDFDVLALRNTLANAAQGNDALYGGDDADSLSGNDGADTLDGGLGDDRMFGGADGDTLDCGSGNDTMDGGTGSDSLTGGSGNDSLIGDSGNDTINFGAGDDTVLGGDGDDIIDDEAGAVLSGSNLVFGGGGNDRIWVGNNNDTVFGGDDVDTLDLRGYGWARADIVYTSADKQSGTVTFFDALGAVVGTLDFTEIENLIPRFTSGTMIATEHGERRVETLQAGDLVWTRDHGLQPLRWVGARHLSAGDLRAKPQMRPVYIARGALGPQEPARDMALSPQHRVLVGGARAELLFAEPELLVAAKHLVGMNGVRRESPAEGVTYVHVLFDRHEAILSDGLWSESFQPAMAMVNSFESSQRDEILGLFPELATAKIASVDTRPTLKAHEARVLMLAGTSGESHG